MWIQGKGNTFSLLVRVKTDVDSMETYVEVPKKVETDLPHDPLGICSWAYT